MPTTGIIIATHGGFGAAMLAAAERMLGEQERCAAFSLDESMGREDLATALEDKRREFGPSLVLVDMLGGSPWNAALMRGLPEGDEVLSGVSLPLLLEALTLRDTLGPRPLAAQILQKSVESVNAASALLGKNSA